jgi:hypothetical protein
MAAVLPNDTLQIGVEKGHAATHIVASRFPEISLNYLSRIGE